jgi:hypothetical protein
MRDLGIADRLRAAGLAVVEVDGWRERGKDSAAFAGGVDHHTAGSNNGNAPSLEICTNGRSDLPGPLCNTLQGFDGTQYVIASGTANHAGSGSWHGLSGNSSVYGMERENDGYSAARPGQHDLAARAWRAILHGGPRGNISAGMLCGHREWAPGRKPDFHDLDYGWFRDQVATPTPPDEPPPTGVTMFIAIDNVGFYALCGHVIFTFRDMASYGASKNASPNVPALVVGKECSQQDRDDLLANLVRQHATATT